MVRLRPSLVAVAALGAVGGASASAAVKVCNILDYGAVGDGVTNNAASITAAIKDCSRASDFPFSADNKNTLMVPSGGVYLTGSFEMESGIDIFIDAGAKLLGSIEESDYPLVDVLPSYGMGRDVPSDLRYQPLIFGQNLTHVSISGSGVIDGNGTPWWAKHFLNKLAWSRPPLVEFMYSSHLTFQDVTLQNSAFWTLHPYASTDIDVQRINILAPGYAPNTDGVDVDSCRNVLIQDSLFRCGDDGIAIKSGLNEYGRNFGFPSENILIRNITVHPAFDNLSTNGISIGSEMSGDVRNVTVENVRITGCEAGLYIKSMVGRGGVVEDILYDGIIIENTLQALRVMMQYNYRRLLDGASAGAGHDSVSTSEAASEAGEGDDTIPIFRNIRFSNVVGKNIGQAGEFRGLENSIVQNIRVENVTLDSALPFSCEFAVGSYDSVSPDLSGCFPLLLTP
jgi:polygalacturonase